MRSIFDKESNYKGLEGLISVYTEKKCLEWLEMRGWGDQTSDYDWILHCVKWEVALYGEVRHGKNSEGTNSRIVKISSRRRSGS